VANHESQINGLRPSSFSPFFSLAMVALDLNQAQIIAQLPRMSVDVQNDIQFGGVSVLTGGSGVNQLCPLIGRLENVTTLELRATDVDDEGVAHLCGHRLLRSLRLSKNKFTERAFPHIQSWQELTDVEVHYCYVKGLDGQIGQA